jgi:HSP20 family protein
MVEPFAPWLRGLGQVLHNQGTVNAFVPPADLLIDDEGVTVYVDVPGLRSEDLDVELENDVLTIRGQRPFPYPQEDGGGPVRSIERGFGKFERSIRVPRGLDPDKIDASLADGVLRLRMPKPETMKPRRISIKAESNGERQAESNGEREAGRSGEREAGRSGDREESGTAA